MMCCVSDVENGAQSGTVRASEYTEQCSMFSSECVLSPKSEQKRRMNGLWLALLCSDVHVCGTDEGEISNQQIKLLGQ